MKLYLPVYAIKNTNTNLKGEYKIIIQTNRIFTDYVNKKITTKNMSPVGYLLMDVDGRKSKFIIECGFDNAAKWFSMNFNEMKNMIYPSCTGYAYKVKFSSKLIKGYKQFKISQNETYN